MSLFPTISLLILFFLFAGPVSAFDMRDCPLDRLTFIDSWAKGQFEVVRSGSRPYFICGDARERVDGTPPNADDCIGPFGLTVLDGVLKDASGKQGAWAIFYADYQTAPCCGWVFESVEGNKNLPAGVIWHGPGTSPTLGSFAFDTIDDMLGDLEGKNSMAPMVCREDIS